MSETYLDGASLRKAKHGLGTTATFWREIVRCSPALAWTGAALVAWSCMTALLPLVDERTFQGVSVWLKPWKFQVSVGTYLLTLALFLAWLPVSSREGRAGRYVVWAAIGGGLFEALYITWQGAHAQASHYNLSSSLYASLYTLMGIGAVLMNLTSGVLGVLVFKSPQVAMSRSMRHAIGWGLIITCVLGTATGGYLGSRAMTGGHWVGGSATDAGGLAIFHWSRHGGDLRVAHFFAIHAMHFLPIVGWMLARLSPSENSEAARTRVIWCAGVLLCVVCGATFLQALRGHPFLV